MSDHKAIREALEAIDAPSAAWTSDEHDIWSEGAPFETLIGSAEDANDAVFIAACNPSAIRALLADLDGARAALTAAKAGGWVAVPEVPTPEMVDAMAKAAHDTDEPANKFYRALYAAMLAARPLPTPPKEQSA